MNVTGKRKSSRQYLFSQHRSTIETPKDITLVLETCLHVMSAYLFIKALTSFANQEVARQLPGRDPVIHIPFGNWNLHSKERTQESSTYGWILTDSAKPFIETRFFPYKH